MGSFFCPLIRQRRSLAAFAGERMPIARLQRAAVCKMNRTILTVVLKDA
ncbi:hypothetical protein XCCB100_1550 [Xanthomonas campestris pv. campestris]|jgi:hypothetical protein|uniref:Uncharacterized protein n=1 Tax=Xanthomonas campestris pv. campestris (strain B100) TaxID=509169 RepID=B0RR15_XANCB|nr:hypothetical protein XCCB100_1550 [Xanthomonas campestris pv. campestris]